MVIGGNGNELSGAIREWEWFFKSVNFGNGNGKNLAGMGRIRNTENHFRTSLVPCHQVSCRKISKTHAFDPDKFVECFCDEAAIQLVPSLRCFLRSFVVGTVYVHSSVLPPGVTSWGFLQFSLEKLRL